MKFEEKWQSTIGDKFIIVVIDGKATAIRRPDTKDIDKFLSSRRDTFEPVLGEVPEAFPIDKFSTCTYRYGGR